MKLRVLCLAMAMATGATALVSAEMVSAETKKHVVPESKSGNLVVGLCDGETSVEVKGVKSGESLDRVKAQQVSNQLMAEWRRKNPNARWEDHPKLAQAGTTTEQAGTKPATPPAPPAPPPAKPLPAAAAQGGQVKTKGETASSGAKQVPGQRAPNLQTGHTYGAFSERDERIWAASTKEFVERGNKVFHDAKELGGTIGVTCDMCHPDGANTHPETYPKYQVQLGRVALLRDMINWCIENPVRGKPLADGDDKMKALEAYMYAQRKGVPLEFGKH